MHINTALAALSSSAVVSAIGPEDGLIGFAEKFGITAALLLYFVYRDYKNQQRMDAREAELVTRIQTLEREHREKLEKALNRSADAVEGCLQKQLASRIREAIASAQHGEHG